MKRSNRNKEFAVITYMFLILFVLLIVYIAYFMFFRSETVINNSYNARTDSFSQKVIRGSVLSDDGTVLAETQVADDGTETRYYPYGDVFSHVVGYTIYGKSGIESFANFYMLRSHEFALEKLKNELSGQKNNGDNVVTTLDVAVQQAAYDALGNYDGAVVVIQPSTGKIIAMVSKPDFDPNTLSADWDSITSDDSDESVLLNRATQGLYPPGSIFKVFTTVEYLRENSDYSAYSFDCDGSLTVDGSTIHCYHNTVHGTEDLETSFAKSCNSSFANIGLTLNLSSFTDLCNSALFNKALPTSFEYKQSSFTLSTDADTNEIMQTSIGQGETLVTPFHMAMIAAAIKNDGVLMTPYIIDHTENDKGITVKSFSTSEYGTIFSESEAQTLQEFMEYTVSSGTATKLSGQSYSAGGKTGTAEYSSDSDASHAWFIGYGEKDGYEDIAIAVIVEGAGSGSEYAVPVAKSVFDTYFSE